MGGAPLEVRSVLVRLRRLTLWPPLSLHQSHSPIPPLVSMVVPRWLSIHRARLRPAWKMSIPRLSLQPAQKSFLRLTPQLRSQVLRAQLHHRLPGRPRRSKMPQRLQRLRGAVVAEVQPPAAWHQEVCRSGTPNVGPQRASPLRQMQGSIVLDVDGSMLLRPRRQQLVRSWLRARRQQPLLQNTVRQVVLQATPLASARPEASRSGFNVARAHWSSHRRSRTLLLRAPLAQAGRLETSQSAEEAARLLCSPMSSRT